MGIWGIDGFASDEALDWLERLDPADGAGPVTRELRSLAEAPDPHLAAPRAAVALAAAELVAALHGQPHPALPDAARRWIDAQVDRDAADDRLAMLVDATRALDFVVTGSQLAEAWSQRGDDDAWRRALDDLRLRLAAAGGMRPVASDDAAVTPAA